MKPEDYIQLAYNRALNELDEIGKEYVEYFKRFRRRRIIIRLLFKLFGKECDHRSPELLNYEGWAPETSPWWPYFVHGAMELEVDLTNHTKWRPYFDFFKIAILTKTQLREAHIHGRNYSDIDIDNHHNWYLALCDSPLVDADKDKLL